MRNQKSLYQEQILNHFQVPQNFGKPADFTFSQKENNPLCGDKIEVFLKVDNNIIRKINYVAEGCAISIASSSILSIFFKEKTKKEILDFKVKDLLLLLKIDLTPTRLKCALLPLIAIQKALN